jgi:hypothetical protein
VGENDDRYDVIVTTTTGKIEEKDVSDKRATELEDLAGASPNVLWTHVKSR